MAAEILERLFSLKGKTALVTGGYTGIGWPWRKAYAEAGAHVAVVARISWAARRRPARSPGSTA
jgi:gluconate 5-dehydrogenase